MVVSAVPDAVGPELLQPPPRRWLYGRSRWPLPACLMACVVTFLGLGALAAYHPSPRPLYTVAGVLAFVALLARLRRIRLVDVAALTAARLAVVPLLTQYVWRWIYPGMTGYPTPLRGLRLAAGYTLGQAVLAVVLLAILDPELRGRLGRSIPGLHRHVVRLVPMAALVALVGWSGHYLVTGSPRVVLGSYTVMNVREDDHACPTGSAWRTPTFPGLGAVPPAEFLGGAYDDRGCPFGYAIAFDRSGRLCFQQVFSSGGSGDSGCVPMRLDATTRVAQFNVEPFGCDTNCHRQYVGFVGRGVSRLAVVETGTRSRVLAVRPLVESHLRALGIAGYVLWSDPDQSSPDRTTFAGYDAGGHVLWTTDDLGRVATKR